MSRHITFSRGWKSRTPRGRIGVPGGALDLPEAKKGTLEGGWGVIRCHLTNPGTPPARAVRFATRLNDRAEPYKPRRTRHANLGSITIPLRSVGIRCRSQDLDHAYIAAHRKQGPNATPHNAQQQYKTRPIAERHCTIAAS
eukprot:1186250-Prorocentrum_minimum.AAC.6